MAEAEILSGRKAAAEAALEESERLAIAVGSAWARAMVWRTRACLRLGERDAAGVREAILEAIRYSRGLGDLHGAAETAELRLRLHAAEAAWEKTARALGCADGLRESSGAPRPPMVLRLLGPAADGARAALGADRFDQERAAAASLSPSVLLERVLDQGQNSFC
jgi:hypothetical protein